jgi:hypothetical protein
MSTVRVIIASPEGADQAIAEFWCEGELMGETVGHRGRLELRIDARPGGGPWLVDIGSLARALSEASPLPAAY